MVLKEEDAMFLQNTMNHREVLEKDKMSIVRLPARRKTPEEEKEYFERNLFLKKDRLQFESPEVPPPTKLDAQNMNDDMHKRAASSMLEDKKKAKRKSKSMKKKVVANPSVLAVPEVLKNAITDHGGEDVVWVSEKELSESDVRKGLNRLSIPERKEIDKNSKIPVDVLVLVNRGEDDPHVVQLLGLNLKMNNSSIYVLITEWWEFFNEQGFIADVASKTLSRSSI